MEFFIGGFGRTAKGPNDAKRFSGIVRLMQGASQFICMATSAKPGHGDFRHLRWSGQSAERLGSRGDLIALLDP